MESNVPSPTGNPAPALLSYAHPPRHLNRFTGRVLCALALLALVFGGARWGRDALEQAEYLYRQHRCLTYQRPVDTVVYDADMSRQSTSRHRGMTPPAEIAALNLPLIGKDLVFLHERRTPSGQPLLVAVSFAAAFSEGRGELVLEAEVFEPAVWKLRSRIRPAFAGQSGALIRLQGAGRFRLFAGRPHPTDPSRVIIPYEVAGTAGTIEAWVEDPRPNSSAAGGMTCGNAVGYQVYFTQPQTPRETDEEVLERRRREAERRRALNSRG